MTCSPTALCCALSFIPAANLPSNLRADLPVLHVWGTKDATASPSAAARSKAYIPRLKVEQLDGVGHWVMLQAKQEVTGTVLRWLHELGLAPKGGGLSKL